MNFIKPISVNLFKWKMVFAFSFLTILIISITGLAKAKDEKKERPSFLAANEELKDVINGNIYAVLSVAKAPKRNRDRRTVTKLYFTDGRGMVLKTFDLFPFASNFKELGRIENFKTYLRLLRRYEKNKKEVVDVLLLDNTGNSLYEGPRGQGQCAFWDTDKKHVLVIYPNEGILKIVSSNGEVISEKKYSNNFHKKESVLENQETNSEGDDDQFDFSFLASDDGKFVVLNRFLPKSFNELILISISGEILFYKNMLGQTIHSIIISSKHKICVISNNVIQNGKILKHRLIGIDFSGEEKWKVDNQKLLLSSYVNGNGFVKLKTPKVVNRRLTFFDTDDSLDIKTGKILSSN